MCMYGPALARSRTSGLASYAARSHVCAMRPAASASTVARMHASTSVSTGDTICAPLAPYSL